MKKSKFAHGLFLIMLTAVLASCGVSPEPGAPIISNNEILIEIETFNIWKNVDGDIVKLDWAQLLGGTESGLDFSEMYNYINREQFVNLIRMSFNAQGIHTKIIDNKYIKAWR